MDHRIITVTVHVQDDKEGSSIYDKVKIADLELPVPAAIDTATLYQVGAKVAKSAASIIDEAIVMPALVRLTDVLTKAAASIRNAPDTDEPDAKVADVGEAGEYDRRYVEPELEGAAVG